jgi:hypothetical protein
MFVFSFAGWDAGRVGQTFYSRSIMSEVVEFTLTKFRWLRAVEALCKMVN